MKTVWKYSIPLFRATHVSFTIPAGGKVLHVNLDPADPTENHLAFWVEVEPRKAPEKREFEVIGTGHQVPAGGVYHGTVRWGGLIIHLYEHPSQPEPPNPATTEGDGQVAR